VAADAITLLDQVAQHKALILAGLLAAAVVAAAVIIFRLKRSGDERVAEARKRATDDAADRIEKLESQIQSLMENNNNTNNTARQQVLPQLPQGHQQPQQHQQPPQQQQQQQQQQPPQQQQPQQQQPPQEPAFQDGAVDNSVREDDLLYATSDEWPMTPEDMEAPPAAAAAAATLQPSFQ